MGCLERFDLGNLDLVRYNVEQAGSYAMIALLWKLFETCDLSHVKIPREIKLKLFFLERNSNMTR